MINQTIYFMSTDKYLSNKTGLDYCHEYKDKILSSGKSEDELLEIIKKLNLYQIETADLPCFGISDEYIGIIHPMDKNNSIDVFSKQQLKKLEICLHMNWGRFSYSKYNFYQSTLSKHHIDTDLEDLVNRGYMTKFNLENNDDSNVFNECTCYFVTEKAVSELMSIWGQFKIMWKKKN